MSKPHNYEPQLPLRPAIRVFYEESLAEEGRCMVCRAWREPCLQCRPEPKPAKANGNRNGNENGKSPKYRQISAAIDRMLAQKAGKRGPSASGRLGGHCAWTSSR